ncbi:alpha/beta fold hydrolase [Roseovarius sp. EL26]|uniref:alpha/beta fold hydrolase n=1 Tax=Roseovarius sp. EL26 TaxID=2126672 RepID=UPI000EA3DA6F|nr:alpha/beta hydrolase [Roseovarius sp. EL26]
MKYLVFVHGFMGGSRQWQSQIEALGASFNVIAVDLPGFGENAHLNCPNSISAFAGWVLADLDKRGISTFHLLGHSMGGMIAQEMVSQAPERIEKLILYGTGATGVLPGRFETIATSKSRAQAEGAKATARRIAATWFLLQEAATPFEGCARIAEHSSMQAICAGLDAMQNWSGVARLSHIEAQSLVLWGDQDRTYSWAQTEQLWQTIGKSQLAVMPNCAHAAHLENPELFNRLVVEFLDS